MKINKTIVSIFVVWLLAMASIIAVPKTLTHMRKIKANKQISLISAMMKAYEAEYEALSKKQKQAVLRYECGLVQMSDGQYYLIGKNCENTEIDLTKKNMIIHYLIDNSVIEKKDLIHLQRRDEISQIYSTLNDAQKRLISDKKALILRADTGQYYMVTDKNSLKEYVLKYGVECSDCGKRARERAMAKKIKRKD